MKLRTLAIGLSLLTAGTIVGVTTQQFASAEISTGDRPVLVPIEPCRLVDTRPGDATVGPRSAPLGAVDTLTVDAQEAGTPCTGMVPTEALSLSLNVTAIGATEQTFLTIWAGGPRPDASSLNPAPGAPPTPNAVTVDLSPAQEFEIYNNLGSVNLIVDVNGYYETHNHDDRYYTEAETEALLTQKANVADVYTRDEIDAMTAAASATRTSNLPLTSSNQIVVSTTIQTVSTSSLLVSAAVEVDADGGNDDNMNCNIQVNGTDGLRQSVTLADGLGNAAVLTLTQLFPVVAGEHAVVVECNDGLFSNSAVESASLAVLAVA